MSARKGGSAAGRIVSRNRRVDNHSSMAGAAHEAGHAVVAERLGCRVLTATDCLVTYHRGRTSLRHGIVITAAGEEAERMMLGRIGPNCDRAGAETDFQLIRQYVQGRAISVPAARAWARREARRILAASWADVQRVAALLARRNLRGSEIRRLLRRGATCAGPRRAEPAARAGR